MLNLQPVLIIHFNKDPYPFYIKNSFKCTDILISLSHMYYEYTLPYNFSKFWLVSQIPVRFVFFLSNPRKCRKSTDTKAFPAPKIGRCSIFLRPDPARDKKKSSKIELG